MLPPFSKRRFTVEEQLAEAEKVLTRFSVHATHDRKSRLSGCEAGRLQGGSLQCHQSDVVLLLPPHPGEGVEFLHQEVHQRLSLSMLSNERLQTGEAEHLTFGIMGLYQPVTVKEGPVSLSQDDLLLLIGHARHEAQGHSPGH